MPYDYIVFGLNRLRTLLWVDLLYSLLLICTPEFLKRNSIENNLYNRSQQRLWSRTTIYCIHLEFRKSLRQPVVTSCPLPIIHSPTLKIKPLVGQHSRKFINSFDVGSERLTLLQWVQTSRSVGHMFVSDRLWCFRRYTVYYTQNWDLSSGASWSLIHVSLLYGNESILSHKSSCLPSRVKYTWFLKSRSQERYRLEKILQPALSRGTENSERLCHEKLRDLGILTQQRKK